MIVLVKFWFSFDAWLSVLRFVCFVLFQVAYQIINPKFRFHYISLWLYFTSVQQILILAFLFSLMSCSANILGKVERMVDNDEKKITRVLFCGPHFPASHTYTREYLKEYPFVQVPWFSAFSLYLGSVPFDWFFDLLFNVIWKLIGSWMTFENDINGPTLLITTDIFLWTKKASLTNFD